MRSTRQVTVACKQQPRASRAINPFSSVAGILFPGANQGTTVQQTDTVEDTTESRRGRLIAELERKIEQLKKEARARDARLAELTFTVGRLQTMLFELDNKSRAAGTQR